MQSQEQPPARWQDALARAWALAGVLALFGRAAAALGERGITTLAAGLTPLQWLALALLTAAFVYGEGVRALQRRYMPFVLRRIVTLDGERPVHRWLAPLYAMSLVGGTARLRLAAWAGSAAIVLAVVVVSRFPDPWRGIVDFAVAAALLWAVGALLVLAWRADLLGLRARGPAASTGSGK